MTTDSESTMTTDISNWKRPKVYTCFIAKSKPFTMAGDQVKSSKYKWKPRREKSNSRRTLFNPIC